MSDKYITICMGIVMTAMVVIGAISSKKNTESVIKSQDLELTLEEKNRLLKLLQSKQDNFNILYEQWEKENGPLHPDSIFIVLTDQYGNKQIQIKHRSEF